MDKRRGVLFAMGLVGVLASGCGQASEDLGDAHIRAAEQRGFGLSSAAAQAESGACPAFLTIMPSSGHKKWLCSNFRFAIDGLPTGKVVEAKGVLWPSSSTGAGPGSLALSIGQADFDAWADWYRSSRGDGQSASASEKHATLTLLGPDLQEELLVINFNHVGITSLQPPTERVASFTVELYTERMVISNYKEELVTSSD